MSTYILYNKQVTNTNNTKEPQGSTGYSLKKVPMGIFKRLLYNDLHKRCKFTILKNRIENQLNIILEGNDEKKSDNEEQIEIIGMPELSEQQLNTYLDLFVSETDNLDKFAEILAILKYEQIAPNNYQASKRLERLLDNQGSYWEDPSNCQYNLNKNFKERRFSNMSLRLTDKTLLNVNQEIKNAENTNYLQDIVRNTNWVDLNIKSHYFMSKNSKMKIEHFNQIYNEIPNDKLRYNFLCNLLVSRAHCHLILNNRELLIKTKPIFEKYEIIFKYLINYAWLTLRSDETLSRTKTIDADRFIFDLETAENLPIYPFSHEDINLNPYACAMFDLKLMNLKNNCMGLDMMKDYKKYYGLCSLNEFKRRLQIFVNGSNVPGILDKIDWSHCVIGGSAMTACGMKYNPLMDICKASQNGPQTDADLALYFLNYYSNSDIDLICNYESIYDFVDYVNNFIVNLRELDGEPKVESVHTGTIIISNEFIEYELENLKKALDKKDINIQWVKANFSDLVVKTYFYDKYYVPWKNEQEQFIKSKNMETNPVYMDLSKKIPKEEFRLYTLDYEIEEETNITQDFEKYYYLKDIYPGIEDNAGKLVAKLSESIRFKVKSEKTRAFEIFKSKNSNFFSTISRFHMGFVRACWNGKTLKCTPSYITSMMLQLTTDYKYFSSIRDPVEIINKYRSRGFGIILNDHEKLHMIQYNGIPKPNVENPWIRMYQIDIKNKYSREDVFGAKTANHEIFKPGKYFDGLPDDCFQKPNHQVVSDKSIVFASLKNGKLDDYIGLKAIGDTGTINPLDPSIIKLGWYKMN